MPLVLATGAPTASGHDYDDLPGVRHAFPRRYRRQMVPGTPFLYYRGRRSASLGLPGPAYFGSAVLGDVPDTGDEILFAEVLDYIEFETPVGIKRDDGSYLEPGVEGNPSYWRRGVRRISDETMAVILLSAGVVAGSGLPVATAPKVLPKAPVRSAQSYAKSKAAMDAVEDYSVRVVLAELRAEFGADAVEEMPHANPGFDILVKRVPRDLHVEVKGTRQTRPVFFLSEGERKHSQSPEQDYRLCVVSAIDLVNQTHFVRWHHGRITDAAVALKPRQWEAVLRDPS